MSLITLASRPCTERISHRIGIQELAIEKGVKDVQEAWASIAFSVMRHSARGEDRGYTLNPCDEISVKLDDDAMALQSMAASQCVHNYTRLTSLIIHLRFQSLSLLPVGIHPLIVNQPHVLFAFRISVRR